MRGIKFIAAGYVQDAEKLLGEFVKENSVEFSVFTIFWKKHNFVGVYLGRSRSELQQFTHEIFQLTLKILVTTNIFRRIGSIYLLYSLFRNQIVDPPARIRIILKQYQLFLELRKLALKEKYKSLHYVIGYLLDNAFDLVAHPTLVGPRNATHSFDMEKNRHHLTYMLKDAKEYSSSLFPAAQLEELQELNDAYSELTKDIPFKDLQSQMMQDSYAVNFKTQLKRLSQFVGNEKKVAEAPIRIEKPYDNIGRRRALIKSNAYSFKTWCRQNLTDEDDDEGNEIFTRSKAQRKSPSKRAKISRESTDHEDEKPDAKVSKIKRPRRSRIPKDKRRIGRPKRELVLENLLMEDDGISKGTNLKGIRRRGPIARTSYLDQYIEQPFSGANDEITVLSSSSEEVIDAEDFTTEEIEEEYIDKPGETAFKEEEENSDDSEGVIRF